MGVKLCGRKVAWAGWCGLLLVFSLIAATFVVHSTRSWSAQDARPAQPAVVRPWDSLMSVTAVAPKRWFVVGKNGVLLSSTDGGRTWVRRHLAKRGDLSWYDLYSVRFAKDGKSGWIVGERGLILHTVDGGKSWSTQKSGVSQQIFAIAPIDSQQAAAAGADGVLLWTGDGGRHWQVQKFKGEFDFFDIAFGDERNGWAVGEFGTIVHSSDGGRSWVLQQGGDRSKFRVPAYLHVCFRDGRRGWVAGQGGTVVATVDGGNTWQPVSSPVKTAIYGGILQPSDGGEKVWFVGNEGSIFNIAAGSGGAATLSIRPTFSSLSDIAFSGSTAIAVGDDGTILCSTDDGGHWGRVEGK